MIYVFSKPYNERDNVQRDVLEPPFLETRNPDLVSTWWTVVQEW